MSFCVNFASKKTGLCSFTSYLQHWKEIWFICLPQYVRIGRFFWFWQRHLFGYVLKSSYKSRNCHWCWWIPVIRIIFSVLNNLGTQFNRHSTMGFCLDNFRWFCNYLYLWASHFLAIPFFCKHLKVEGLESKHRGTQWLRLLQSNTTRTNCTKCKRLCLQKC